jgi:predicted nucleic acid-binding protein
MIGLLPRPILNFFNSPQLSSYDATYLELAMRRKLPLATQDNNLILAAKATAVPLFRSSD